MRNLIRQPPTASPPPSILIALLLLLAATPAFARSGSHDHVSFGNDITVNEGESADDVACAFCSVHLHGDVRGDVAVAFGSVSIEPGHSVGGDLAVLGGDVSLPDDTHIGGDVNIAAGDLNLAPGATISGDRVVLPGRFWLLIPFAPIFLLIGVIWLIVYLIRRNRYQFPVYPNGRRI